MSFITVTGVLTNPSGTVLSGYNILFEAIRTSDTVVNNTSVTVVTDSNGAYSFELGYGTYTLKIKSGREARYSTVASNILIYSQVLDNKNIQQILLAQADIEDVNIELIDQLLQIRADVLLNAQNASTSETNAAASAASALTSKNAAAASATSASSSAATATTKASAAATSETNAAASAATATTKATEAATSATSASSSATTATTKASEAATSATTATTKASEAATSATTATTKATEAAASATSALASKNAAATSETNAASSASSALASKNAAATSATSASSSATTASTSATSALASKNAAATSETNAAASAAAASTSEQQAAIYAASLAGGIVENGGVDLSSGVAPTPRPDGLGGYISTLWKVTVGGTVNAVNYAVGDSIVYSKALGSYYKIDSTDQVSSVNGMSGAVNITSITGNAGSATILQTARTIATSGDVTGTATSFNGSANITIPLTLANTGVTAGTYKSVTVDSKGRVTSGSNPTTLAGYGITDGAKSFGTITVNPVASADSTCTTAEFISFLTTLGMISPTVPLAIAKCSWTYAGNNNISDIGLGFTTFELAGCVIEVFNSLDGNYTIRISSPTTSSNNSNSAGSVVEYNYQGAGYAPGWIKVYTSSSNGNISGNASTATKLATACTINGVAFDGSANITIADNTKLPLTGGTLTGSVNMGNGIPATAATLSANTPTWLGSVGTMGRANGAINSIKAFTGEGDYFANADRNPEYTVTSNYGDASILFNGNMADTITVPVANLATTPWVLTITRNATITATDVLYLSIIGHRLVSNGVKFTNWKVESLHEVGPTWVTVLERTGVNDDISTLAVALNITGGVAGAPNPNYHFTRGIRLTVSGATEATFSPGNLRIAAVQLRDCRPSMTPARGLNALDTRGGAMFGDADWKYGTPRVAGSAVWHAGNDGAGSGLDADLLDGLEASQFIRSDAADTITGALTSTSTISATQLIATSNGDGTNFRVGDDAWFGDVNVSNTTRLMGTQDNTKGYLIFGNGDSTALGRSGTGALTYGGHTVWHSGNDGSGSGLDADLLDGQDGAYYCNATNINAGTLDKARLPASVDADTTGNAATATKLATARQINGVNFDGTANITIADDTKLPLTGGTITGPVITNSEVKITGSDWNDDRLVIEGNSPSIKFKQLDTTTVGNYTQIGVNIDRFFLLSDRNLDGEFDSPYALEVNLNVTTGDALKVNGFTAWTTDNLPVQTNGTDVIVPNKLRVGDNISTSSPNDAITSGLEHYLELRGTTATYPSALGVVFHHENISTSALVHGQTDANSGYFDFRTDDTNLSVRFGGEEIYNKASGLVASSVYKSASGTAVADLVKGTMADNDKFRIRIGGTAPDSGWAEIATADNGNEPIYVRQYSGDFGVVTRTLTLLDASGNTIVPGNINAVAGGVSVSGNSGGIYNGNGDAFSSTVNNVKIQSWYGIGFAPSISGQTVPLGEYSHWFNTRNGDMGIRGTLTAPTFSGALSGNASTASTLQTARTINGVSFNGSANVTVEPYIETDSSSASRYLTFVDSVTAGYQRLNMDGGLTYNPSTNVLSAIVTSDINEVGKVVAFARSSAPSGFLKCNGAAVSRTTYAALYAAIGTTFGSGDGSTTFNVPDLRGEFVRGWDDARGIDSGRTFGSWQDGQNESHTHTGTTSSDAHTHTWSGTTSSDSHEHTVTSVSASIAAAGTDGTIYGGVTTRTTSTDTHTHTVSGTTSSDAHTHTMTTAASGGTEVRVRNRALLYCIKY